MGAFLDQLIAFAGHHAGWAYLTLFLAALLEAVPILGSLIPGSTIILALSALVPGGQLALMPVLAAAAAGALIGDGTAYWIGRREQRQILEAWPMSRYPELVARSEAFFKRFGIWAVFAARFVPPIRAFVPVTAGALGLSPARFFAVNILAILLWAPAHVLPGVLAATELENPGGIRIHHWLPLLAGVVATLALAAWAVRWWRKNHLTSHDA
ncbi:DedA family protein [Rhodopseudomonas palustris]|uniref:DedA family n=1 Tax=Rhodopseudomonas palustris (strain BisB18) TaxID=316056 RepID=Q21BX4_RHOPB